MPIRKVKSPWAWFDFFEQTMDPYVCNICWWTGAAFDGFPHSESLACHECGSIARDRFLFFCFVARMREKKYKVLETSPRLGETYQDSMAQWFDYRASDFDLRSHKAQIKVDLQNMDLEDESLDVLLTPHVLEHVPETDLALREIFRVLAPGGRMYLQVPVVQGWTTPPLKPEFHQDDTPVEWKFGLDLTSRLREQGFRTRLLCNQGFYRHVKQGGTHWPDPRSFDFDVESMLAAAVTHDLLPVASDEISRRVGFFPGYMFLTWECEKPYLPFRR